MTSEREARRRKQANAKGNRQDARFFERRRDRYFRIRKAVPGEFEEGVTHAVVWLAPNEEAGTVGTRKRGFTGDTELPDDEATAEYLAALIEGGMMAERSFEVRADLGLPEPALIRFSKPEED